MYISKDEPRATANRLPDYRRSDTFPEGSKKYANPKLLILPYQLCITKGNTPRTKGMMIFHQTICVKQRTEFKMERTIRMIQPPGFMIP